jgi:hypothetical protein
VALSPAYARTGGSVEPKGPELISDWHDRTKPSGLKSNWMGMHSSRLIETSYPNPGSTRFPQQAGNGLRPVTVVGVSRYCP